MHDADAEAEFFSKLNASGLIVLHENCSNGTPCAATPGGIVQEQEEGLLTAPGMKLYVHRKKWRDSSMRVYDDEEEENEEENVDEPV